MRREETGVPGGSQVEIESETQSTYYIVVEVKGMIDVHYTSLTSQGVQLHWVFYLDGHSSRYLPCPTGLNFGEQTGTSAFPLVIAVPRLRVKREPKMISHALKIM